MNPGRLSRFLLLAAAGASEAEFVAGDLYEEFTEVAKFRGASVAQQWYFRQVLRSIVPLLTVQFREPIASARFTETSSKSFGLVTVIVPVTFQSLSVKPVSLTFTV